MRSRVAKAVLWITLAVVLVSVLLPNTCIAWMRDHWAWFNWPMLWIERAHSVVNLIHAILFVLLGFALRLGLPRWRVGRVAAAFALFGIATELIQLMIPGRHSRVSDVVVDVVAGTLGWAVARVLVRVS